jgi:hypothetical protein
MSILGKTKGRPTTRIHFDMILKQFTTFLKNQLHLKYDIPVIIVDDAEFAKKQKTFGMMNDKIIYVSIINRHPMDILRTFAHEVVHYKQVMEGKMMNSLAGGAIENQANAKAGELMRKYGQLHPELFDLMPIR